MLALQNGDLEGAVTVFFEMKQALPDFSRGAAVFSALVKACRDEIKDGRLHLKFNNAIIDACFAKW